jgi:glycosyltransferase involved in cell wall biosynthesis
MKRQSISVVMPTYNSARFIAEAIDSILGQTVVPDQIIVVDDGSSDDTRQVVSRYTDARIEYIWQPNGGVSSARNAALDAARGDFVTFLDADDRWRPTFVEKLHDLLAADPEAVCAFSNFVRFEHATGKVLRDQFSYYPELLRPAGRIHKDDAFSTLVSMGEIPAFPVVMMYRRAMIESLRFDKDLRVCEDMHFALRAFLRGSVMYTDEVLCDVRRHDSNASQDVGEMAAHKLNALRALQDQVIGHHRDAYHDRLVKAHIDAALYRLRTGLRCYREALRIPGSKGRKLKGLVRMILAPLS